MKTNYFCILLFWILSSCSPKELPKDNLFVILDSKPSTLDPRKATDANGMRLVSLIFNGFVKFGNQGELLPDAASSWKLAGLTWTFYLKPNLSFSNGRAVSKEDILFSFEEFKKKSSPFHSAFKNIRSVEVSYEKLDELPEKSRLENLNRSAAKKSGANLIEKPLKKRLVVKILMKSFQAPFLHSDLPVIKILPKKEILKSLKEFQKNPMGSGDFELTKNSYHQILLKRRSDITGFSPKFISFQIIRDSFTRTQKMLSREADIAPSVIPLQKVPQFKQQKQNFRVVSRPGLSTTYLLINLKNKLLKNKELRKALSLSIHREELIKHKLQGYAVPAKSFVNPGSYFFNKKLKEPVFDLQETKNIVQALGLKGASFQLSSSNNQDTVNKAKVLASQMSQAGLKIKLQSNEWGAFYKDVGQGAYEMALMKWVGVMDPDIYRVAFHSDNLAPQGRNRSFYADKKILDELLDQGFTTRDKAKRKQIYDQVQQIIAEDFIVIPLWHDMEVSIVKANVENYHLRFNGDFLSLPLVKKK